MRKEEILLQHVADASGGGGYILIAEVYFSRIWVYKAGKNVKQSGLSGAADSQKGYQLALFQMNGNVLQDLFFTVCF